MLTSELRWGANAPEDLDGARSRLIDASERTFARLGIARSTVEEIAKEAKVSRATVYRYFDGREELVLGVVLRTADRYLERTRPKLEQLGSLADVIVEFLATTERATRRDPNLSILFTLDEAQIGGGIIAGASLALFERVAVFFRPFFVRWAKQVRPGVDVNGASEWILRTLLSSLVVQGPQLRTTEGQKQYLRTYLVPAICKS